MSNPIHVKMEGLEGITNMLKDLPAEVQTKMVRKAFNAGGKIYVTDARPRFTGRMRDAITAKRGRSKDKPSLYVGLIHTKANDFDYMKAYWKNFGTLANRDSTWPFIKKRRKVSQSWKGGIKPSNAMAQSWKSVSGTVYQTILKSIEKDFVNYLKKAGKR
jgi:hypothetical protein